MKNGIPFCWWVNRRPTGRHKISISHFYLWSQPLPFHFYSHADSRGYRSVKEIPSSLIVSVDENVVFCLPVEIWVVAREEPTLGRDNYLSTGRRHPFIPTETTIRSTFLSFHSISFWRCFNKCCLLYRQKDEILGMKENVSTSDRTQPAAV